MHKNNSNFNITLSLIMYFFHNIELKMKIKKLALVGAICATMTPQALAESELLLLIEMLHKNGTVDDAQYQRLLDEINAGKASVIKKENRAIQNIKKPNEKQPPVEITVDKGGIQFKSSDNEFSAKIGGRVQLDSAWYEEDGAEMGNGTEIRRARLYIQGHMFYDWGYKFQYDFTGSGKGGIKDAFLTYNGFDSIQLKAGNFKDPFMLQEQTSSKYVTFTERSLLDTFSSGRHLGVMASTKHKHWTASAGFFGDSVSIDERGKDEG